MARVTGIGGVFFKARDPKALTTWYAQYLGIQLTEWGGINFDWSDEIPAATGSTALAFFPADSKHFPQTAMVNLRVDDLEVLLATLREAKIPVDPHHETHPYGHFAWITDPEGNRIELWQPLPPA